nr:unnamed protein product [Digitaria exilis]
MASTRPGRFLRAPSGSRLCHTCFDCDCEHSAFAFSFSAAPPPSTFLTTSAVLQYSRTSVTRPQAPTRARRVRALGQHRRPERVQRPDLEREATASAGEEAHEHQVLVRARAVEPPVHVGVQQQAHGVHVTALQRAVQRLHHRLAAHGRRLAVVKAQATGIACHDVGLVASSQLG